MTIGPSADGGYYLIGFNKPSFTQSLFDNIPWSTRSVYKKTLHKANLANLSVYSGKQLNDIDTLKDLKKLFAVDHTVYSMPHLKKVYTSLVN